MSDPYIAFEARKRGIPRTAFVVCYPNENLWRVYKDDYDGNGVRFTDYDKAKEYAISCVNPSRSSSF